MLVWGQHSPKCLKLIYFNTSLTIFIGAGFERAQLLTWKSNHLFKCSVGDVRLWALQKTWHILFVFV